MHSLGGSMCRPILVHIPSKAKDGSSIDFMALTMIDPAFSWFEFVELPTITRVTTKKVNGKREDNQRINL